MNTKVLYLHATEKEIFWNETFQNLMLPSNSKGDITTIIAFSSYKFINISVSVEVALLKKYYSVFCHCLPQDCTVTMTRLKQSTYVEDEAIAYLLSLSNPAIINERIVAVLFKQIKSKEALLQLCELFEQLVDPESKIHIEMFRNGKYTCNHLICWSVAN